MKKNSLLIKIGTLISVSILIAMSISIQNNIINNKNISEFCLGNKDAKHTLVFYFSLECEYCKDFFLNIIPHIKSTYLQNNYVKIIFKEIPLNTNDIDFFIFAKSYDISTYIEILLNYYKNYFKTTDIKTAIYEISKKINKKITNKNNKKLRQKLKLNTINFVNNTTQSLPYLKIDNQKFDYFISKHNLQQIFSGEILHKR